MKMSSDMSADDRLGKGKKYEEEVNTCDIKILSNYDVI